LRIKPKNLQICGLKKNLARPPLVYIQIHNTGIANTHRLGSPCRGWAGRPRRGAGGRPRGRLLSTCTGTEGRTGNSECSSPGLSGIPSPLRSKSTSVGSYLAPSYKGIGSPDGYILKAHKIKSVPYLFCTCRNNF